MEKNAKNSFVEMKNQEMKNVKGGVRISNPSNATRATSSNASRRR